MTVISFFIGLALLATGGEGLVRGAATLGERLHLSPLVVGLTIVAFATSAPELAISVGAALKNEPGLALGNVIGSNIANLALILGLITIVTPSRTRIALIRRDALVMAIVTLLVPGLLLDNQLERVEGGLLILCITAYISLTVWHTRSTRHEREPNENRVPSLARSVILNLLITLGGLGLLVYGSSLVVDSSVVIATVLGVPTAVVGLSAAAVGSSLPELSAAIIAARHGHPEMAAGNLIGSNIFNLLMILGTTSLVRPLSTTEITYGDLAAMVGISALALFFMITKQRVTRLEGGVLLSVYLVYIFWLYYR